MIDLGTRQICNRNLYPTLDTSPTCDRAPKHAGVCKHRGERDPLGLAPDAIKVCFGFSFERIADIIEGANVGYWANVHHKRHSWKRQAMELVIVECPDGDPAEGTVHTLGADAWPKALALAVHKAPHTFAAIITAQDDMYTGDALVQLAVFGEIKYG